MRSSTIERPTVARAGRGSGRSSRVGRGDHGMATAEYAIGTCAAAGLGGILFKLLTGDGIAKLVENLIGKALSFVF